MKNLMCHYKKTALLFLIISAAVKAQTLDIIIENPEVISINKLPARASFFAFESEELAEKNKPSK